MFMYVYVCKKKRVRLGATLCAFCSRKERYNVVVPWEYVPLLQGAVYCADTI